MKKSPRNKIIDKDIYKIFKPQLSPKKMLELGVFGGSYFGLKIKEYPKAWFKNAKIILGTWQGLYLFEHRLENQIRKISHHFIGDTK